MEARKHCKGLGHITNTIRVSYVSACYSVIDCLLQGSHFMSFLELMVGILGHLLFEAAEQTKQSLE